MAGKDSSSNYSLLQQNSMSLNCHRSALLWYLCITMVCSFYCWIIIPPDGLQIHWLSEMYLSCFQFFTVMNSAALFIWTVVLEKTLKSPLNFKIKRVNPKGNQPWRSCGRTDPEVEAPILWPSDPKSWHIGKDPDAGKDWRQEEKRTTGDEMVGLDMSSANSRRW